MRELLSLAELDLKSPSRSFGPCSPSLTMTYTNGDATRSANFGGEFTSKSAPASCRRSLSAIWLRDFLANTAALSLGRDVVVTSAYRDPTDSRAHASGAIDVRCSKNTDTRFIEAQRISNGLRDNWVTGIVIVEEVLPGGFQVNTYFKGGMAWSVVAGPQSNNQLHTRGTHIHLQLGPGEEVPVRYPVAIRNDGDSDAEIHTSAGQSYKGPLKATKPHGDGVTVEPDGSTFKGHYVEGKREGPGTLGVQTTAYLSAYLRTICRYQELFELKTDRFIKVLGKTELLAKP